MADDPTTVMWFRRDLRLTDNPALIDAVDGAAGVVPLFVFDPRLWDPAGPSRRAYLVSSLTALRHRIGGLVVRSGDPVDVVGAVAKQAGAARVHIAEDFGPYGASRDRLVENALGESDIPLVRTGSPYAVSPGRVLNKTGDGYQVFTPFSGAWREHGWRPPAPTPRSIAWDTSPSSEDLPQVSVPHNLSLPTSGEQAARRHWRAFLADRVDGYGKDRDRPDLDATSHMSVHLKWGEIHPRTMLADLEQAQGNQRSISTYRTELAWREFYADVLHRRPESAREYYKPDFARMRYDTPGEALDAWKEGRTGYPVVDACMRQVQELGWMHNRGRLIVASFLTKDLLIDYREGERHFMWHLTDGDLANNNGGWQWTASVGTDRQPIFRIFNPTLQATRFDPAGEFVRRWVPELAGVPTESIHEPWRMSPEVQERVGCVIGRDYPAPIVGHAQARARALDAFRS